MSVTCVGKCRVCCHAQLVGLAAPSLTFDLNEHQARQSFQCAASYVSHLLPPIGHNTVILPPNTDQIPRRASGIYRNKTNFFCIDTRLEVSHRHKPLLAGCDFKLGSLAVFDDLNDRSAHAGHSNVHLP
jgi:hypothetical protein